MHFLPVPWVLSIHHVGSSLRDFVCSVLKCTRNCPKVQNKDLETSKHSLFSILNTIILALVLKHPEFAAGDLNLPPLFTVTLSRGKQQPPLSTIYFWPGDQNRQANIIQRNVIYIYLCVYNWLLFTPGSHHTFSLARTIKVGFFVKNNFCNGDGALARAVTREWSALDPKWRPTCSQMMMHISCLTCEVFYITPTPSLLACQPFTVITHCLWDFYSNQTSLQR